MTRNSDIFTYKIFGREPSVADLLKGIACDACSVLLAQPVDETTDIDALVGGLGPTRNARLCREGTLVIRASRLEPEVIEQIVVAAGIPLQSGRTSQALICELIRSREFKTAKSLIEPHLRPEHIATRGTFAEFDAPFFDVDTADLQTLRGNLQQAIEAQLQVGTEQRLARVRLVRHRDELLVSIHFQRPESDGAEVTSGRTVRTRSYAQSAGMTFFALKQINGRSRLIQRQPESKTAQQIRIAIGTTFWSNPAAISPNPVTAHNLGVFRNSGFQPAVHADYSRSIGVVLISHIDLTTVTGNRLVLRSPGRNGNAFEDLKRLTSLQQLVGPGSVVREVGLKFLGVESELVARAKVEPTKLTLDEVHLDIVRDHLRAWGVLT